MYNTNNSGAINRAIVRGVCKHGVDFKRLVNDIYFADFFKGMTSDTIERIWSNELAHIYGPHVAKYRPNDVYFKRYLPRKILIHPTIDLDGGINIISCIMNRNGTCKPLKLKRSFLSNLGIYGQANIKILQTNIPNENFRPLRNISNVELRVSLSNKSVYLLGVSVTEIDAITEICPESEKFIIYVNCLRPRTQLIDKTNQLNEKFQLKQSTIIGPSPTLQIAYVTPKGYCTYRVLSSDITSENRNITIREDIVYEKTG